MRKEYEMTSEQLKELLESCKPVPAIMLQCGPSPSVQESANAAWRRLGDEMGFDHMTARPTERGDRFFTAEPRDPSPYCSYGHKTKADCDCGPIASNE